MKNMLKKIAISTLISMILIPASQTALADVAQQQLINFPLAYPEPTAKDPTGLTSWYEGAIKKMITNAGYSWLDQWLYQRDFPTPDSNLFGDLTKFSLLLGEGRKESDKKDEEASSKFIASQRILTEMAKVASLSYISLSLLENSLPIDEKTTTEMLLLPASDTTAVGKASRAQLRTNIYNANTQDNNAPGKSDQIKLDAIFDSESLLGPLNYGDSEHKLEDAQNYFLYISNLAPPPLVIVPTSTKFSIPYSKSDPASGSSEVSWNDRDIKNKTAGTSECSGDKYCFEQLKKDLDGTPIYREYRLKYRTNIAARSLFSNNILEAYQRRLPVKKLGVDKETGKDQSVAQFEANEANRRLTKEYFNSIVSHASPATIQRETLFLLAEIHNDLWKMQQNQEKLLVTESVIGFQNLVNGSYEINMKAHSIGKLIYCAMKDSNKKYSECINEMGTEPTGATAEQPQ